MPAIEVFTDGACSGNPGAGGWGVILRYGEIEKELSGGEENTTNNRMELTAVIEALKALKKRMRHHNLYRQPLCDGRRSGMDAQLETQRLENHQQEIPGKKCGTMADS